MRYLEPPVSPRDDERVECRACDGWGEFRRETTAATVCEECDGEGTIEAPDREQAKWDYWADNWRTHD